MIPYTPDAVSTIRNAVNGGTPPDIVRQQLGWDASMFDGICRRHGIDVRSASLSVIAAPDAPLAPDPEIEESASQPAKSGRPRGGLTHTTIALPKHIARKLDVHPIISEVARKSRSRTAGAIVERYITAHGARGIENFGRMAPGKGVGFDYLNVGLTDESLRILVAETKVRGTGTTVSRLVKGLLVAELERS